MCQPYIESAVQPYIESATALSEYTEVKVNCLIFQFKNLIHLYAVELALS